MVLVGEEIIGRVKSVWVCHLSPLRPMCTHRRVLSLKQNWGHWMVKHLWRFLSKAIFLAFMLSGRSVLFLIISVSSPWLISSHVYYSFTLPSACGVPVPVRLLTMIYESSHFCTQIIVTKSINSLRCGAKCLKYHTAGWRWGIYKEQIIVQPFPVPQSSLTSAAFLSHWATAPVMSHIPTPPPRHSTSRSLAWILAAFCRHVLRDHINWIQRSPC